MEHPEDRYGVRFYGNQIHFLRLEIYNLLTFNVAWCVQLGRKLRGSQRATIEFGDDLAF
jgi:hypothetical protein